MPTSSSESSEGTTSRPTRRRTTAKAASSKASTRSRSGSRKAVGSASDDAEAVELVEKVVAARLGDADDFGDGVDGDEKPAKKTAKRAAGTKRPARRAKASADTGEGPSEPITVSSEESGEKVVRRSGSGRSGSGGARARGSRSRTADEGDSETSGSKERELVSEDSSRSASQPRQLAFFSSDEIDFGDGDSGGDSFSEGVESSGGEGGEEGDRRPRRRRRRRRRGTGEGRPAGADGRVAGADGRSAPPVPRGGDQRNSEPRGTGGGNRDGQRGRGRRRGGRPSNDDRPRRGRTESAPRGGDRGMSGARRARQVQSSGEVIEGTFEGVLELHPKGYGFLRDPTKNYAAEDSNPFVSSSVVEKYQLREGVLVRGDVGQGTRNQGPRLREVELIDGFTPEEYVNVKHFDNLTPINPFEQIRLETGPRPITMRVMDLLCPIGKGQRALLVAPPRTGKTMLLQDIANSVSENHPEIKLMVLLIDERPEEVTEMRRLVNGEIISSSLDNDVESHIRISQLIIERGKRLAEEGKDVFILLDSITRMARAFNKWSNSGRTASGGLDIRALDIPKKLFGTARRFDEGGSLTVCGTALIDTGNRMDEAIFQEFKGTGNMEMVLSRDLADRRIWPAIDVSKSGTRREEKILSPEVLDGTTLLRRSLISLSPVEAMEQLTRTMEKFPTNQEFLQKIRAIL